MVFVTTDFFFFTMINNNIKTCLCMYLLLFEIFLSLGPFCWRVLSDCAIMELEPLGMISLWQANVRNDMKNILYIWFSHFSWHRHIGGRIFPCRISIKKSRFFMTSVLTHLLKIETVSKLLHCGRKSQNYVHIIHFIANQNWYHDDKSTL